VGKPKRLILIENKLLPTLLYQDFHLFRNRNSDKKIIIDREGLHIAGCEGFSTMKRGEGHKMCMKFMVSVKDLGSCIQ
jgi:hypothetical protein